MARVTRSTRSAAQAETAATTPQNNHTADIPIRSIENNNHGVVVPSKETDNPKKEAKKPSLKKHGAKKSRDRDRQKAYKKKRRQQLIAAIKNVPGKPYAERDALKAEVYRPFKTKMTTKSAEEEGKKVVELQQLAEAQRQEIAELQRQLAGKQSTETGPPKPTGSRRGRKGGFL